MSDFERNRSETILAERIWSIVGGHLPDGVKPRLAADICRLLGDGARFGALQMCALGNDGYVLEVCNESTSTDHELNSHLDVLESWAKSVRFPKERRERLIAQLDRECA